MNVHPTTEDIFIGNRINYLISIRNLKQNSTQYMEKVQTQLDPGQVTPNTALNLQ